MRLAVRTQPTMLLRASGWLPSDLFALPLFRVPPPISDRLARFLRRVTIGDLAQWGLTVPEEGLFTRCRRTGGSPTLVDKAFIVALKSGRIEIVPGVSSLGTACARLTDGTELQPDAIIAAIGFGTGLEPMVGHLGVLDARGVPLVRGGPAVAPGLRFLGYVPNIRNLSIEARRVVKEVSREVTGARESSAFPLDAALK